jgi:hypothetical protein
MGDRDTKGDVYEDMLAKIASAGQNGQFRTPRHIIAMMVELVQPKPEDVMCDPAVGTCGLPCCGLGHRVGDGPVPRRSSTGRRHHRRRPHQRRLQPDPEFAKKKSAAAGAVCASLARAKGRRNKVDEEDQGRRDRVITGLASALQSPLIGIRIVRNDCPRISLEGSLKRKRTL